MGVTCIANIFQFFILCTFTQFTQNGTEFVLNDCFTNNLLHVIHFIIVMSSHRFPEMKTRLIRNFKGDA